MKNGPVSLPHQLRIWQSSQLQNHLKNCGRTSGKSNPILFSENANKKISVCDQNPLLRMESVDERGGDVPFFLSARVKQSLEIFHKYY